MRLTPGTMLDMVQLEKESREKQEVGDTNGE